MRAPVESGKIVPSGGDKVTVSSRHREQCGQIGLFLKGLGNKFSYQSSIQTGAFYAVG